MRHPSPEDGSPLHRALSSSPRLLLALGLVSATVAFFHRAALTGDVFAARDILRVYYPIRQYWAERFSHLQYPDWYPFDGLGQPFAGMVISGAFHPSNVLYALMPLGVALKLNVLACYPIAAAGAFACARLLNARRAAALFAGISYAFCGCMIGSTNNLLYLMAAATFPWALWAAERFFRAPSASRLAPAVIFSALVLFAGDSQSFALCNALILMLGVFRTDGSGLPRRLATSAGLLVVTALVGAAQWIPALNVLENGVAGLNTLAAALRYSLHPVRVLELLLGPLFLGPEGTLLSAGVARNILKSEMGNVWTDSTYLGLLPFVFAAAALWNYRRRPFAWGWLVVAAFGLLLCLGKFSGVYAVVYEALPLWRPFRYPEKLLPYVSFLVAIASGVGLGAIDGDANRRGRCAWVLLALAGLSVGVAGLEMAWGWYSLRFLAWVSAQPVPDDVRVLLGANLVRAALVTAAALGAVSFVLWRVDSPRHRLLITCAIQGLGLFWASGSVYQVTDAEVLEQEPGFVKLVRERQGRPALGGNRVLAGSEGREPSNRGAMRPISELTSLQPVTPSLYGIEGANRYLPATSARVPTSENRLGRWLDRLGPLFSVGYTSLSAADLAEFRDRPLNIVARHRDFGTALVANADVLPRAYLAREHCVPDANAALQRILAADFEVGQEAVVECGTEGAFLAWDKPQGGTVRIAQYLPEQVDIEVWPAEPGLLVLNDAFYPGWGVTVDGQSAELLPTNLAVRGVRVPAGLHRVVFTYRTPGARAGLAMTVLTIAALALAIMWERRAHRRQHPGAKSERLGFES